MQESVVFAFRFKVKEAEDAEEIMGAIQKCVPVSHTVSSEKHKSDLFTCEYDCEQRAVTAEVKVLVEQKEDTSVQSILSFFGALESLR